MKIVYLNINGLLHTDHRSNLNSDRNLKKADLICIAESKLSEVIPSESVQVDGFTIVARLDVEQHSMGIILYKNNDSEIDGDLVTVMTSGTEDRTQIL